MRMQAGAGVGSQLTMPGVSVRLPPEIRTTQAAEVAALIIALEVESINETLHFHGGNVYHGFCER
jgi:hypothetical protein